MAFNEFYVDTGGNDVNSGSTTSTTASVTSTNGDWGSVTANRFTPNGGGTPFSTVSVGDWASIYLDGAVLVVYIAQVTAVNGSGATLDFSTTAKYGTSPATGATGRSIKIGGAWATPWAFINTGVTAVYNSTRINVKAGTYASGAVARTWNNVGAATAPLWFRGYNATIGDLDNDFTTAKPAITFGNVLGTFSGAKTFFTNLSFTGARTGGTGFQCTAEVFFKRCRFESTASGQIVMTTQTTGTAVFTDCYFKGTATASRIYSMAISTGIVKCTFDGGVLGLEATTSPNYLIKCVFIGQSSHGLSFTASSAVRVFSCTFKGCGGDGIRFAVTPSVTGNSISNCMFDSCVGWGVNNAGGTNALMLFEDNDFYVGGGSGTITGFGDVSDIGEVTESSSPGVSSTDPTIASTSFNGASMLRPFEGKTWTGGYYDAGAVQRQVTTGGGGSTEHSHLFVGP